MQLSPELEAKAAQRRKERASNASRARKSFKNQYSSGKRDGLSAPEKDRLRAEYAAAKLERYLKGEVEMDSTEVAAAKIVIDKGKPSLQAVEQMVIEPAAVRSEAELLSQLRELLRAHPHLVEQLMLPAEPVAEQQTVITHP